jgi:hypothetical protein
MKPAPATGNTVSGGGNPFGLSLVAPTTVVNTLEPGS